MKEWALVVSVILIIGAIIFGPVIVMARSEHRADCVSAGYAGHVRFAGEMLCLGVVDGEWQIEPLDDVRARLEGR